MIAKLKGYIEFLFEDRLIIDVNSVCYEVYASKLLTEKYKIKDYIEIYIYTHMKESALQLFGFSEIKEKLLFIDLISVSGVGIKAALNITSNMKMDAICSAIANEDKIAISNVQGIGSKTASRIILELKKKIEKNYTIDNVISKPQAPDSISALIGLGIEKTKAVRLVNLYLQTSPDATIEDTIKYALQNKDTI